MPSPGDLDVNAFMAGFGICEAAMGASLLGLLPLAMLRKILTASGW